MTLDSSTNRKDYNPDGLVLVFPYDFRVDDADDMVVYEDGVIVVGGYGVNGIGEEAGGDVTFVVPPEASVTVLALVREVPLTQETSYPALGPFPANSHEAALDKLTMISQQLQEQLDRSLLTGSVKVTNPSVPDPVAGQRLQWKDDLTGFENVDPEIDTVAALAVAAQASADASAVSAGESAASALQSNDAAVIAVTKANEASDDADSANIAANTAIDKAAEALLSAGEASDSEDAAAISETNAAASAAAAALYDPTWAAWIDLTLTAAFSNARILLPLQYRLSVDGSQVQVQGEIINGSLLTALVNAPAFDLPIGALAADEFVQQPIGYSNTGVSGRANLTRVIGDTLNIQPSVDMPSGSTIYIAVILGRR